MNEFIIWDKKQKKLIADDSFVIDNTGNAYHWNTDNTLKFMERYELCNYTGLKDINDKKIYADSSIVEFKLIINPVCRTAVLNRKGVFKYDKDLCAYIIECIDEDRILIFSNSFKYIKNIKIIDTIQENKLGLMSLNLKDR